MARWLLPIPVILMGTGKDSGAGSAFICMPEWQAVLWAKAARESAAHAVMQIVTVRVARCDTRRIWDERSMSVLSRKLSRGGSHIPSAQLMRREVQAVYVLQRGATKMERRLTPRTMIHGWTANRTSRVKAARAM